VIADGYPQSSQVACATLSAQAKKLAKKKRTLASTGNLEFEDGKDVYAWKTKAA